jgi:7-carboxy-7-deazaguanine synthase
MSYAVKEIFYSLQGEGAQTGRPAVFCRFSGCNLWTGREEDRSRAICRFCDTDFVGTDGTDGGRYEIDGLVGAVTSVWVANARVDTNRYVICTGGEPLLQLDPPLIKKFQEAGFAVAVETNGTLEIPPGIDWITVSPKVGAGLIAAAGNELKLVYPQAGDSPERYEHLAFDHFFLQPMDGPERSLNTDRAISYCLANPRWRLSLQTHKLTGLR